MRAANIRLMRAMVWIVLVTAAFVASGCVLPRTGTSASRSSAAAASAAPAGSAVRDGKFEFQVINMTRAATAGDPSNQFEIVKPQGEFIIVTMSVRNIGDRPQSYFGGNQKLIDTSGRQYGTNSEASMWMNSSIGGDINPGNSIQVKEAFDVPPGTHADVLEVHDSMMSGGAMVHL